MATNFVTMVTIFFGFSQKCIVFFAFNCTNVLLSSILFGLDDNLIFGNAFWDFEMAAITGVIHYQEK